jgi:FimV-like protein
MAPVRPLDIAAVQAASVRPVIRGPEAPAQRLDEDRITYWGDTLWSIALAARFDSSISVQAMMLAIQSSNPDAFMSKNINRLKAGYVLVMPDQEDLDRISYESAVAEVASQNMEQMLSASQPPPAGSSVDSELVLVAVDVEEPSADSDEALAVPGSAGEKDQLINSATVERNLMAGRLVALETKLESLASTISLRDQRITSLQKQLKTLETLPKVLPEQSFLTPMSISFMVALVMLVVVLLLLSARYQRLTRSLRAASASVVVPESQGSNQAPADAGAQREADFSELGLSELGTLEDIEALNVLKTLKELEDPIELETLDVTDAGGLSEADVASELGIDPDEDPVKMLDLARAYVDMGDSDAARSLLNRVAVIGTPSEASEAQKMLVSLSEG